MVACRCSTPSSEVVMASFPASVVLQLVTCYLVTRKMDELVLDASVNPELDSER